MEFVSKERKEVVTLAHITKDDRYECGPIIELQDHSWKSLCYPYACKNIDNHYHSIAGIDFKKSNILRRWFRNDKVTLVDSYGAGGKKVCFICSVLESNPDISLQEIQMALLEVSGTSDEQLQGAYEYLCCGRTFIKPAKF